MEFIQLASIPLILIALNGANALTSIYEGFTGTSKYDFGIFTEPRTWFEARQTCLNYGYQDLDTGALTGFRYVRIQQKLAEQGSSQTQFWLYFNRITDVITDYYEPGCVVTSKVSLTNQGIKQCVLINFPSVSHLGAECGQLYPFICTTNHGVPATFTALAMHDFYGTPPFTNKVNAQGSSVAQCESGCLSTFECVAYSFVAQGKKCSFYNINLAYGWTDVTVITTTTNMNIGIKQSTTITYYPGPIGDVSAPGILPCAPTTTSTTTTTTTQTTTTTTNAPTTTNTTIPPISTNFTTTNPTSTLTTTTVSTTTASTTTASTTTSSTTTASTTAASTTTASTTTASTTTASTTAASTTTAPTKSASTSTASTTASTTTVSTTTADFPKVSVIGFSDLSATSRYDVYMQSATWYEAGEICHNSGNFGSLAHFPSTKYCRQGLIASILRENLRLHNVSLWTDTFRMASDSSDWFFASYDRTQCDVTANHIVDHGGRCAYVHYDHVSDVPVFHSTFCNVSLPFVCAKFSDVCNFTTYHEYDVINIPGNSSLENHAVSNASDCQEVCRTRCNCIGATFIGSTLNCTLLISEYGIQYLEYDIEPASVDVTHYVRFGIKGVFYPESLHGHGVNVSETLPNCTATTTTLTTTSGTTGAGLTTDFTTMEASSQPTTVTSDNSSPPLTFDYTVSTEFNSYPSTDHPSSTLDNFQTTDLPSSTDNTPSTTYLPPSTNGTPLTTYLSSSTDSTTLTTDLSSSTSNIPTTTDMSYTTTGNSATSDTTSYSPTFAISISSTVSSVSATMIPPTTATASNQLTSNICQCQAGSSSCDSTNKYESSSTEITLEETVEQLVQELTVNKTSTSAHRRSLTSAKDERQSSQAIGVLAISIITVVSAFIVVPDAINFINGVKTYMQQRKMFQYK